MILTISPVPTGHSPWGRAARGVRSPEDESRVALRFSMAPDGKSFVYPTAYYREDLWMLTGYRQLYWWGRIADALNSENSWEGQTLLAP